ASVLDGPTMTRPVRVRIGPSPTGEPHVGTAYIALFNLAFARKMGGKFILRIEDTDRERSLPQWEREIVQGLRWLGLEWDEGPEIGGDHGPYRQSERLDLYRRHADELIERGFAYRCFCSEAALEKQRERARQENRSPHYELTCFAVSAGESQKRATRGEHHVVRFHVPKEEGAVLSGDVSIDDLIRGRVRWGSESLGDFILLRADGMPTYNFSVVVDDHEMRISHVIRAEEHLTNTHRQVLIYRAFGWDVPEFAHVSLILGEDRAKLSKRHGATSITNFQEDGYLPKALVNYLTLLGWTDPEEREKLPPEEIARLFSFDHVTSSPAVFDINKLTWLNGLYLHEMDGATLAPLVAPRLETKGWVTRRSEEIDRWLEDATEAVKTDCVTLHQFVEALEPFFVWTPEQVAQEAEHVEMLAEAHDLLEVLERDLETHGAPTSGDAYKEMADRVKEASGAKGKALFMPIRIALTGRAHGRELQKLVPLLDRAMEIEGLVTPASPFERVRSLRKALE
ncbi:MAG: glutamate--tRNA ligase, partial [Acidobacteria bacterium]|nr:glutamate--tRNA ligase [Acidobacteriota bacterium]